jgi:hypothetical protein
MAGTCVVTMKRGYMDNSLNSLRAYEFDFTADAADASFPVASLSSFGVVAGNIVDVGVIFDGTTPPSALTLSIADGYGAVFYSAAALAATQARGLLSQVVPTVNGVSVTPTGNATNSAKAKIIVYVV